MNTVGCAHIVYDYHLNIVVVVVVSTVGATILVFFCPPHGSIGRSGAG